MTLPPLYLKRREERRVRAGHPWVFSNEVDVQRSPLVDFEPGDHANLLSHSGKALATVYVNAASLICARVVSRRPDRPLDAASLRGRLDHALALRQRLGFGSYYRLAYGESDGLPGLVVDRHGEVLVAQISTAGMARLGDLVAQSLRSLPGVRTILVRNDALGKRLEGLRDRLEWVPEPATGPLVVVENEARFPIDPERGQKTGWYYDHRLNRARVASYARDARVLDLFSYRGGFGVQAARAGARHVLCVDRSQEALEGAREAAVLNDCADRVQTLRADAFDALKALHGDGERFDLVIADPPAFAPRKRDLPAAREAYRRLNRLAMRVLVDDGLLFTASCSSHLQPHALRECVKGAAGAAGRRLQLLEQGHQGPDHPLHPSLPESAYLKALLVRASL